MGRQLAKRLDSHISGDEIVKLPLQTSMGHLALLELKRRQFEMDLIVGTLSLRTLRYLFQDRKTVQTPINRLKIGLNISVMINKPILSDETEHFCR